MKFDILLQYNSLSLSLSLSLQTFSKTGLLINSFLNSKGFFPVIKKYRPGNLDFHCIWMTLSNSKNVKYNLAFS